MAGVATLETSVDNLTDYLRYHSGKEVILSIGCGREITTPRHFDPKNQVLIGMDPQLDYHDADGSIIGIKDGYCHVDRRLNIPSRIADRVETHATIAYIASYPLDPFSSNSYSMEIFEEIRSLDNNGLYQESRTRYNTSRIYDIQGMQVVHQRSVMTGNDQWRVIDASHMINWTRELARIIKHGGSISSEDFIGPGGYSSREQCLQLFRNAGFTCPTLREIRDPQQSASQTIRDNQIEENGYGQPVSISARVFHL